MRWTRVRATDGRPAAYRAQGHGRAATQQEAAAQVVERDGRRAEVVVVAQPAERRTVDV